MKGKPGLRFTPPPLDLPAELDWVLLRALGPADQPFAEYVDPARAGELADQLLLMARIGRRTPQHILEAELGQAGADCFATEHRRIMAVQMQYKATSALIAKAAATLGITVVFLKGMALQLLGIVHTGDRVTADIDVLVASQCARQLHTALVELGFTPKPGTRDSRYHLRPLWHPQLLALEIHIRIPGLRLTTGATSATAQELEERGLLQELPVLSESSSTPSLDLLLAHLAAHALAQHSLHGAHFFRFLCDFQALLQQESGSRELLLQKAHRWISWLVGAEVLHGLSTVVDQLAAGVHAHELVNAPCPGATTLRHFCCIVTNRDYLKSLLLHRYFFSKRSDDLSRTRFAYHRLWWTREQASRHAGEQLSHLQFLGWTLRRPFRILRRLLSVVAAWARVKAHARRKAQAPRR